MRLFIFWRLAVGVQTEIAPVAGFKAEETHTGPEGAKAVGVFTVSNYKNFFRCYAKVAGYAEERPCGGFLGAEGFRTIKKNILGRKKTQGFQAFFYKRII